MITGYDEISIKAMEFINNGQSTKYIISTLNISIGNLKKLSMLNNFIVASKDQLSPIAYTKLKSLGLKACVLANLFKENDFNSIELILSRINETISRRDLSMMPKIIEEEKKLNGILIHQITELENQKNSLEKYKNQETKNIIENSKILSEIYLRLDKCSSTAKNFLYNILGINNGNIVLYKKLYQGWHNYLKNKLLIFDKKNFVWIITDLDYLIENTEKRILKGKKLYFDSLKVSDYELSINPYADVEEFKNAISISNKNNTNLEYSKQMTYDYRKKIKDIDIKIKSLQEQLKNPHNSKHSITSSSFNINENDFYILTKNIMQYFLSTGYIVCNSVPLTIRRSVDIAAYYENDIIFIKIIDNKNSLTIQNIFKVYQSYCTKIFLSSTSDFYNLNIDKFEYLSNKLDLGILIFNMRSKDIKIIKESKVFDMNNNLNNTISLINANLSKKYLALF